MNDYIEFLSANLGVEWEYDEGEKATWNYPGSPERVNILKVTVTDAEINILSDLPAVEIENLEQLILNRYYR